jgi:hypothetical protein
LFNAPRFVIAVVLLAVDTNNYQYSQNVKIDAIYNYGASLYGNSYDAIVPSIPKTQFGAEVAINAAATSLLITRTDGQELRLVWVGIFSTGTDCVNALFEWQQTTMPTEAITSTTVPATFIVRAI